MVSSPTDFNRVLSRDGSDTILAVWVVSGASRSEIVGVHGDALRVRVSAPPEHGKANRAMLKTLGACLDAEIVLESGSKGRRKRVRIAGLSPSVIRDRLLNRSDGNA